MLVLARSALSQGQRGDSATAPRGDTTHLRADTGAAIPQAALQRDTSHHLSRADSILTSYHPDTTKVKAPITKAEDPLLMTVGPSYHWNRDQLFASGALTLADLLGRIPGFNAFRGGWMSAPMTGTYMGNSARIRIFYDGIEVDPLDPGMRWIHDLATVDLWTLDAVSVERGADELRVYIRTWSVDHTTPTTRADVLTGNQETNLYRAFFGKRFDGGAALQFAAQQFTNVVRFGGGGTGTSLFGRFGWARGPFSFDAVADRYRRGMDPLSRVNFDGTPFVDPGLPDLEKNWTNAYVRAGLGSPDHCAWLQVIASSESFRNSSPLAQAITVVTPTGTKTITSADSVNSESQYVAAAGFTRWGIRFSGTERFRVFAGHGTMSSPSARASWESGPLAIQGFAEENAPTAWPTLDSLNRRKSISSSTEEVTARLNPLPFVSFLGDAARTVYGNVAGAPPSSLSIRLEAGLRLGSLWFAGGVIRRDSALVQAPSIFDTTYVPAAVGPATGYYGSIRGTLWNLFAADIQGTDWGSAGPYRPKYESRSELSLSTEWLRKFPRHTFHILVAGIVDYTTSVPFPTMSGTTQYSTGGVVGSTLVELRILHATITWQFRNVNGYPYNLVPGYIMPRQTNLYGVRWDFWG